ncbi:MAG: GNAT family N-acetyltransferase, partial [Marinosulfonomonas sp.]|nr:GNAT family N-acetyltransferase [Marinosulfonomonas sp.]
RVMRFETGTDIQTSYSAQFYDLSGLQDHRVPMLEIGRFCVDPQTSGADVLRTAWGALTLYVDQQRVRLLFGCSSFSGTDTRPYLDAFALLSGQYLAPNHWRPNVKAADVVRFVAPPCKISDEKQAWAKLPPLLRSYLAMGGWVSDHAVVDINMNSLHVFTGLDISAIPPARARLLRAVAKSPAVAWPA